MSDTLPFTRRDAELCAEMSMSFHHFLIQMEFKGDYETAICLERELEKDAVLSAQDLSIVHLFQTWKLCFKRDVSPLWLTPSVKNKSPIPAIMTIIEKLGNLGPKLLIVKSNSLRFDNGNQFSVSSYFSKAGLGMSITELVMEDCPSISVEQEMMHNLCPVMYSVTKGSGRVISIR